MNVAPEKFDVDFWKDIAKLLGRLAMLAMIVLGGTGAVNEVTHSGLKEQEAKAATVDNRVVEAKRETDVAYEEWADLLRYHDMQAAACDSALESFSRHRDDERDWAHVLEECHSDGGLEGP
jgi:hypothetical protein